MSELHKKLNLSKDEAKKPIGIDTKGNPVTLAEYEKVTMLNLATLDTGQRLDLVLKRYDLEKEHKISILQGETITKKQLVEEIKAETDLGRDAVQAEMSYLTDIHSELLGQPITMEPAPKVVPVKPWPPKEYYWVPKNYWWWFFKRYAVFTGDTSTTITNHAHGYRVKNVIPCFPKHNITPIILAGTMLTRANFAAACKKRGAVYISGVGHGSSRVFTGERGAWLWEVCNYDPDEVKGKIIHLLSCKTAQELGPDLVKKGACAYFGYDRNFTITWNYPDVFWLCDSVIDLSLCNGFNAEVSARLTIQAYNLQINRMRGIHGPTAVWLTWDRDSLKTPLHGSIYGKKTCTLRLIWFVRELEEELTEIREEEWETIPEMDIDTHEWLAKITEET